MDDRIKLAKPFFNIVQVGPEIPQNTGTIGRLCVSCDIRLHLIKPLGFRIEDKYLRRAGMDYWAKLDWQVYDDFNQFLNLEKREHLFFFSTKGKKSYWDVQYPLGAYLIFGAESYGFPSSFYRDYADDLVTLPMPGTFHRSINVANSVSVALYEAMRQNRNLIADGI